MIGNKGNGNSSKKGFFQIDKFGENIDIDTATVPEVVASFGGMVPFLDAAIEMDIVSSSVNDTFSSGTGARTILLDRYFNDNSFDQITVEMNGQTRVQLPSTQKTSTRMKIVTSGSLNGNEGNIDIVDRATGLIVYQRIPVEGTLKEGQTLSAFQLIEKGKRGVIKSHYCKYAKIQNNSGARLRLRVRGIDGTVVTKYNVTIDNVNKKDDEGYPGDGGIEVFEGEWVFWEVIEVSANDTPIEAGFSIQLWDIA